MKRPKVISRLNLPSRFPFGVVAILLWFGEKLQSPAYWTLAIMTIALIAAIVMFRQFTELEVELKDLEEEKAKEVEVVKCKESGDYCIKEENEYCAADTCELESE